VPLQVLEFREMVAALHEQGWRVVLDVVYNHTFAAGPQDRYSVLDKVVPGYYHRWGGWGAGGCGAGCCGAGPAAEQWPQGRSACGLLPIQCMHGTATERCHGLVVWVAPGYGSSTVPARCPMSNQASSCTGSCCTQKLQAVLSIQPAPALCPSRRWEDGDVCQSTCCNNTATENLMCERLIIDDITHWAKSYKVDGFRWGGWGGLWGVVQSCPLCTRQVGGRGGCKTLPATLNDTVETTRASYHVLESLGQAAALPYLPMPTGTVTVSHLLMAHLLRLHKPWHATCPGCWHLPHLPRLPCLCPTGLTSWGTCW
jgi:hypothetical protein